MTDSRTGRASLTTATGGVFGTRHEGGEGAGWDTLRAGQSISADHAGSVAAPIADRRVLPFRGSIALRAASPLRQRQGPSSS